MSEYFLEKKSKDKQCLKWKSILLIVIYIAIACSVAIGIVYLYPMMGSVGVDNVCQSENCLKAALNIISSIDRNEDPCYDFYQYVCGNFMEKAFENNNPSLYSSQMLTNANKLHAIISEPISDEESSLLQQKTFYQSCMNVDRIDNEGLSRFEQDLHDIGGWPVIKSHQWSGEDFHLSDVMTKCKNLGIPFHWFFDIDFLNNSVIIDYPKINKYNERLKESTYFNLMVETAINFGTVHGVAVVEMKQVLYFEKNLQEMTEQFIENKALEEISLDELSAVFPAIPWLNFINETSEDEVIENDLVVVADREYIRELNLLLARTPRRVQANFIVWKIIEEFGFYLSTPIRENFLNFTNFMVEEKEQMNTRFKFCINEAIKRFPGTAEAEFVRRYITAEKVENIKEMISNVKAQFLKRLNAAEWIDEDTKEGGINILNNMRPIIGQLYLEFDKSFINDFPKLNEIEFNTTNIIDMLKQYNKNTFNHTVTETMITEMDILTTFLFSNAIKVNAGYMIMENILFLTPGLIQDIFYSMERPNYLNYGSLGSIIGHEIAHAFSKSALSHNSEEEKEIITELYNGNLTEAFDKEVFLNNLPLWQNESLQHLNEKIECVKEDMKEDDGSESYNMLVMENFADLIGVDIAYEAYNAWAEEFESEEQLPSLNFSPQQLFWIQFGATNCHRVVDSVQWNVLEGHGSQRYRVTNILKNSYNFARDFNCPQASVMNPIEKCQIF